METDRKASGASNVFAALIVAVIVVSAATAVLSKPKGAPSQVATVASSSSLATRSSSSSVTTQRSSSQGGTSPPLGLRLTLSVNSTTIPSQDAIGITASVLNTLPTENNLSASDGWAIGGLSSGPCDPPGNGTSKLFFPVGVGVFRGTYGLNNISSAGRPLFVWAVVECIIDGVLVGGRYDPLGSITSYSLHPGSDNGTYAAYYGISGAPACSSGVCTQTPGTLARGVFPTRLTVRETIYAANNTGPGFYNSLLSSLPANYTLVAGDEWGQLTLLRFSVVASDNLPQVGSFLASNGGCAENGNPVPCVTSFFSRAFIFDCAAQAATPSGCTTQVPSSGPWGASYAITVWYPYPPQPGEPAGDNCRFSVPGDTSTPYAHCFMVNATSFALSLP